MALKDTTKTLKSLLDEIQADLEKADAGNKAAAQRVRTGTIRFEKAAKVYRKESVKADKNGAMKKAKVAARKKPAAKPAAKSAHAKTAHHPAKPKSRPAAKKSTPAKKIPTAKKKATAKLPSSGKKKK